MLTRAEKELDINLKQSFMVGDKLSDIEAGERAGCKTILVRTGYGTEELKRNRIDCNHIADNIYDAVEYILGLSQ
jgi:D-glycero-D-manno-heptose 1,7-bisphosphate phosphatase